MRLRTCFNNILCISIGGDTRDVWMTRTTLDLACSDLMDSLTQTLGEKTNPVPIELAIVRGSDSLPADGSARQLALRGELHRVR